MSTRPSLLPLYGLLFCFLACNIALWTQTHKTRAAWANVPPAPSELGALAMALGDRQFAYRMTGLMLENIGNTGGDSVNLTKYDFNALKTWFLLAHQLDPASNFVPTLAAYYFGATTNPAQLTPVIDYLVAAGQRPEAEKWRWLAQAVYLARYKQQDLQKALDLANLTASLKREDMPLWAKSMPAFVMTAQGNKAAAYQMMVGILSSGINHRSLDRYEIRYLRDNICNKVLSQAESARNPLCTAGP